MQVRQVQSQMQMAAIYNSKVGANISHVDVDEWGIIEEAAIMIALEMW